MHEQTGPESPSGFGFELTMRLKREEGEKSPPTWPAAIMQALAKYVFQSGAEKLSSNFLFIFYFFFFDLFIFGLSQCILSPLGLLNMSKTAEYF